MTEDELAALVAGGHQPEVFIWRVDADDGPSQWAVVADDEDMTNEDGSRRQFGKLAEVSMLLIRMGVKQIHFQGAETTISLDGKLGEQEIEGLDDETLAENLNRIGFKPPGGAK